MVVESKDLVGMHRTKHMSGMKFTQELIEIVEMHIRLMDFASTIVE
jgi:hypothetical protein